MLAFWVYLRENVDIFRFIFMVYQRKNFSFPHQKYKEQIINLSTNEEFNDEVKKLRKLFSIPIRGFKNYNQFYDWIENNKFCDEIDPAWNFYNSSIKLKKEYFRDFRKKYAGEELKLLKQWLDFCIGGDSFEVFERFGLKRRSLNHLKQYVFFGKEKYVRNFYDDEQTYGSILFTGKESYRSEISSLFEDFEDLSAVLLIFPETTKSDLIKTINYCWEAIEKWTDKSDGKPPKNTRKRVYKNRDKKILSLHKKGLTAREIATAIGMQHDGRWPYIRTIISRSKKRDIKK